MSKAKVVVVFPVYNGAETLEKSLECIARQTFRNFRAIILENVCTDNSLEIAERFCARDARFSIVRNDHHLAVIDNFVKAIELGSSEGEYFCLRACDDMSSDDFLEKLVEGLDANPDKLLAACDTLTIGSHGSKIKRPNENIFGFQRSYVAGNVPRNLTFPAEWIYGLFRSDAKDRLVRRWQELGTPWCLASFTVAEFVVLDLVVYVKGPAFHFYEGSDSEKKYRAVRFRERWQQRWRYTLGCYRLVDSLPRASLMKRLRFFSMCWNDARRKTRYKFFWYF